MVGYYAVGSGRGLISGNIPALALRSMKNLSAEPVSGPSFQSCYFLKREVCAPTGARCSAIHSAHAGDKRESERRD
jgi:hypothetical protein